MTESDDLIELLRRAQPDDLSDDLVSPHDPAAQALLEEILSMPAIEAATRTGAGSAARRPGRAGRAGRRRVALSSVAAAAVIAAGLVAAGSGDPSDVAGSNGAVTVQTALANSSSTLARSGRAEVRWEAVYGGEGEPLVEDGLDSWEFSGDDWSVTIGYWSEGIHSSCYPDPPAHQRRASCDPHDPVTRYVDGEAYYFGEDRDGTYRWFHDVDNRVYGNPANNFTVDPSSLLAELRISGEFEEVGREEVDGVRTQRLRALNPGELSPQTIGIRMGTVETGQMTALEIWVGDDGLARRVDLSVEGSYQYSMSVRFFDFDRPITIEVPPDAEETLETG